MFLPRSQTAQVTSPAPAQRSRARRAINACCRPELLLALLVVLGAAARLRQYFAMTSYWHDEAFLLLNVFEKSFAELVGPLTHDQAAPPIFLWFLRACYLAFGSSELAMRLPALIASLGALILMVPLARAVIGGGGAVWAVGCASVSSCLLHLTYQVKPYTTDVLIAEAVLLATVVYLRKDASHQHRRASAIVLLIASVFAPWISFPSVFMLAGSGIAVFADAAGNRGRHKWGVWIATQGALLASCGGLWLAAARHHNTPYQQSFWAADFVDLSSGPACLRWMVLKLVEAGNYGVQGTGIGVALLAVAGLISCWRDQRRVAIVLAAPACLACVAAALHQYPLGNRLLAFLLPPLWLTAACGLGALTTIVRTRAAWLTPTVGLLLVLPGGVRTTLYSVVAKPSVEFRQAFEYVHQNWREGDSLWVSQPAVYEAYFGKRSRVIDDESPREILKLAARQGRVWMVCHPPVTDTTQWNQARQAIESCGATKVDHRQFVHLDIGVYMPPAVALTAR